MEKTKSTVSPVVPLDFDWNTRASPVVPLDFDFNSSAFFSSTGLPGGRAQRNNTSWIQIYEVKTMNLFREARSGRPGQETC